MDATWLRASETDSLILTRSGAAEPRKSLSLINMFTKICCLFIVGVFLNPVQAIAGGARPLLDKGWSELVKDNDIAAMKYFEQAYEKAISENNTEDIATALLNMGICSYSVSYTEGLAYCFRAMEEFEKLEVVAPEKALNGRCRCLQLISTINARQGKYRESLALSHEAISGFSLSDDSSGYLGLIYNSIGNIYSRLNIHDSAEYYNRLSLQEHLRTGNLVYLPSAYLSVAAIEHGHGNKIQSLSLYNRAMAIADSTENRQAQVSCLLGLGEWVLAFEKNTAQAETYYLEAKKNASTLTDKTFYISVLGKLIALKKQQQEFAQALIYQDEMLTIRDTLYSWEKQKTIKILEIQFNVAEKDRQLKLTVKEKDIALLINYILWGTIGFLIVIFTGAVIFLKRINKRDRLLIKTKEALVSALEEQKQLKELHLQNELEYKESQLNAMTFQMLQKNELMHALKDRLEQDKSIPRDSALSKMINKGLSQDKEWSDFNTYFESINKNFYVRLRAEYPEISPNDLKVCALIKMNLSIKEMAGILNISPDSVKTSRYRLRKKLQLNTEDNLTGFILNL